MKKHKHGKTLIDDVQLPEPKDDKIKFSFEFYEIDEGDYCLSGWDDNKIKKALKCLKDINRKTFNEFHNSRGVYHFGPVDWSKTTKKNGFPDPGVNRLEPYHFALVGVNGQLARVFGAFSKGTFYIVWFDLHHNIWPSLLKNT